ncbi:MAG: glycosyltransferase [Patescibacteria group bacterium]|nr:glycosyltransferase [Patescibacteria group bacterium]
MRDNFSVTLIVPCYNEVANLQKGVLDKIGNYVTRHRYFTEVLIVDDGSSDGSRDIIRNYAKDFPKFRLIENPHQGKAFAIITGIREAKGSVVMFSDIDLATPIEESEKLIAAYRKGSQIVIGSRSAAREGAPLTRKILAFGLITLRGLILGLRNLYDTQCGFKLFETASAKSIIEKLQVFRNGKTINGSSVSAGFDLEFLFVARKIGCRIAEVPVIWRHVETKNVNFITDSIETLRDMFMMRYYYLMGRYDFDA